MILQWAKVELLLKHPSASLPLVMSLAALALFLGHVALFGMTPEADAGAAAALAALAPVFFLHL